MNCERGIRNKRKRNNSLLGRMLDNSSVSTLRLHSVHEIEL